MSFYQIDSRSLRTKREELAGLAARFRQEKETLISKESALLAMWEGQAKSAFHSVFVKNSGMLDAFSEVVDQYIGVMGAIADRYDAAEQKNLGRCV
ncbi:MAG: WXG100 family type VII secretion target [Lachnospiraceae bacterium]|nr:WXG100 family type VII secretion target [Lachnospiraceae bacterium]